MSLSSCGGGSNGPSAPPNPTPAPTNPSPTPTGVTPTPIGPAATPTATPINPTGGGQLLFDDFTSPTLNAGVWDRYTPANSQPLQRTGFGNNSLNMTENGTSFTRLTLDAYNPDAPGQLFRGTEIFTRNSYTVGNGLEAEARIRAPGLPPGLVCAFFLINNRFVGAPTAANDRKNEIDYEILTEQEERFGGRNRLYTNVWSNWNAGLYGFDSDPTEQNKPSRDHDDQVYQPSVDPSYDYANWNVYKIRWYPDRTEFYVNGKLERVEKEVKPDQGLSLHLNFWTPTGDFNQAFSGKLSGPVPSADNYRSYNFDVDYVRLTALTAGAGSARLASGSEAAKLLPKTSQPYRVR